MLSVLPPHTTHGPGDGGVEGWRVEGGGCCPVKAAAGPLVTLHPAEVTAGPAPAAARCGHRQCLCTLAERSNKLVYSTARSTLHITHVHVSVVCLRPDSGQCGTMSPVSTVPPPDTVISSISMATVSGVMLDARAVSEPSRSFTVPTGTISLSKAPVGCDLCVSVPISCFLQSLKACLNRFLAKVR